MIHKSRLSPHQRRLEDEATCIIREFAAEFRRPVMLYSVGKDSSVMLPLSAAGWIGLCHSCAC
jgi:sulfate adenylyltransferase subunit 2